MKFFIDTAEVGEIRAACELGLVDGVTTNPSLHFLRPMLRIVADADRRAARLPHLSLPRLRSSQSAGFSARRKLAASHRLLR